MSSYIFFDASRRLMGHNILKEQAEAIAYEIEKASIERISQRDLDKLYLKVQCKLQTMRADIFKWFIGAFIAQTATIIAVSSFLNGQ